MRLSLRHTLEKSKRNAYTPSFCVVFPLCCRPLALTGLRGSPSCCESVGSKKFQPKWKFPFQPLCDIVRARIQMGDVGITRNKIANGQREAQGIG